MNCGLGTAAPPSNLHIAEIVQRIEQKPLPLGGSVVRQNALGGDYVFVTLSPIPMPPVDIKTAAFDFSKPPEISMIKGCYTTAFSFAVV